MTVPPSELLVVKVFTAIDIKAFAPCVSDVSSFSLVEAHHLRTVLLVWSDDSSSSNFELLPILVGDGVCPLRIGSD